MNNNLDYDIYCPVCKNKLENIVCYFEKHKNCGVNYAFIKDNHLSCEYNFNCFCRECGSEFKLILKRNTPLIVKYTKEIEEEINKDCFNYNREINYE